MTIAEFSPDHDSIHVHGEGRWAVAQRVLFGFWSVHFYGPGGRKLGQMNRVSMMDARDLAVAWAESGDRLVAKLRGDHNDN